MKRNQWRNVGYQRYSVGGGNTGRGDRSGGSSWQNRRTDGSRDDDGSRHSQRSGFDSGSRRGDKPPAHLRGRAIGMFYAQRSRGKAAKRDREERPLIRVDSQAERNLTGLVREMDRVFGTSMLLRQKEPPSKRGDLASIAASRSSSEKGVKMSGLPEPSATSTSCWSSACEDQETSRSSSSWRNDQDEDENAIFEEDLRGERMETEVSDGDMENLAIEDLVGEYGGGGVMVEDSFFCSPGLRHDDSQEAMLRSDWIERQNKPAFQRMLRIREKLPMSEAKEEFRQLLHRNQVCVISGETGCGKSTQVPQMILDDALEQGTASETYIVVTQPRRISATSLAYRVMEERAESGLGNSVGYQIRLEAKRPRDRGGILYCTNGILLRWLLGDRELQRASHVVLDEIHERDLNSDFLLIIVRDLLRTRKNLKVILMSATLNAKMFSEYFGGVPTLTVPGRLHRVIPHFLEEILDVTRYKPPPLQGRRKVPQHILDLPLTSGQKRKAAEEYWTELSSYANSLIGKHRPETLDFFRYTYDEYVIDFDLILALSRAISVGSSPDEAILIFLPGWMDISKLVRMFAEDGEFGNTGRYWIVPLHSLLPSLDQRKVFNRPNTGCRKIVIATNIAETSITVEDVVHVIDCGKIKMHNFDVQSNIQTLRAEWVSQGNAEQRRGRAGRVREGHCYHLFTKWRYEKLGRFMDPEMLRTRLENLCLQIKMMELGGVVDFLQKAPQSPPLLSISKALEELVSMGALDGRTEELTPLGWHLARLPIDPHCAKMIIFGAIFSCIDPVLTVAACLDYKDPFHTPMFKEKEVDAAKRDICKDYRFKSDYLLWAETFHEYKKLKRENERAADSWARTHFINLGTMRLIDKMKGQFCQLLKDVGFVRSSDFSAPDSNINSENYGVVVAVVCGGLYPRIAESGPAGKRVLKFKTRTLNKVLVHPKSVNATETGIETRFVAYHQMVRSSKLFLNDCGMVSPYSLILFGGDLMFEDEGREEKLTLDKWIKFFCSCRTATLFSEIRRELDALLERRVNNPRPIGTGTSREGGRIEDRFVEEVAKLLGEEEISFKDLSREWY